MPEENTPIPEGVIEVKEPAMKEGEVQFMSKAAFDNPTPSKLKLAVKVLQGFCLSMITMVSGTTLFTGNQSKWICFVLGALALLFEGINKATGVVSNK